MPRATEILRSRRRRKAKSHPVKRASRLAWALLTLFILLTGLIIINGALLYAGIANGLPDVELIEGVYGPEGARTYQPVQIFDHSGGHLLFEAIHPDALERRWLRLDPVYNTLAADTLQSIIAAQDPTFWENNGYQRGHVLETIVSGIFSPHSETPAWSITQQLAYIAVLPLDGNDRSPSIQFLRSAAIASDLTDEYAKRTLLEWYINSADFGNLCYGLDAAALVYFGIHASELSLAQSAMLATIPSDPAQNPFDDLPGARQNQRAVLQAMVDAGTITQEQANQARRESLQLNQPSNLDNLIPDFAQLVLEQANSLLGEPAHQRPGIKIISTLDYDLQRQLQCTIQTQQARLNGRPPAITLPASDGSTCLAAELLPPLRPGDANFDHQLQGAAGVIFEPQTGRLLASSGSALEPRFSGTAFSTFIYLAAFSQGNTPASMTLDIHLEDSPYDIFTEHDQHMGPQRMRTAMVNDYTAATLRTLELVGVDALVRIARPLGLISGESLSENEALTEVPLYQLAYAYAVLANRGWMAGVDAPWGPGSSFHSSLQPAVITGILNSQDQTLYFYSPFEKSVASPQLSYLINNVLSDESARTVEFGQTALYNLGRTTAIKHGVSNLANEYWTIGYSPNLLVGIWAGSPDDNPPLEVDVHNSTMPIWNAVFRYASRDLPIEIWEIPPGVTELEVCDPSGLLPTPYCPTIVREAFINGTEPTRPDDLFQPIRINRETGNLATVLTPFNLVEERVYMVLPPEAENWAAMAGIDQPPEEYDSLVDLAPENPEVRISSPLILDWIRGEVSIRGDAHPEGMESYRLLYGRGLNPSEWIQIGSTHTNPVTGGLLGRWDTLGLEGIFTLQLEIVDSEGRVMMDYVPLSIDNTPPTIEIQLPEPGESLSLADTVSLIIQASVEDAVGLEEVRIYVNNQLADSMETEPYSLRWTVEEPGEYEILIRAVDLAGNTTESDPVIVTVTP